MCNPVLSSPTNICTPDGVVSIYSRLPLDTAINLDELYVYFTASNNSAPSGIQSEPLCRENHDWRLLDTDF
jgi:hypothetical protein